MSCRIKYFRASRIQSLSNELTLKLALYYKFSISNFLRNKKQQILKIVEQSGQSPSLYVQVLSVLLRNVCEIQMLLGPQCKYFFSIQYILQKTYTYDICEN